MTATEAMYLHLNGAHGLSDFTEEDLAEAYPSCVGEGGAIDVRAVHAVDHAELGEDLEHRHEGA